MVLCGIESQRSAISRVSPQKGGNRREHKRSPRSGASSLTRPAVIHALCSRDLSARVVGAKPRVLGAAAAVHAAVHRMSVTTRFHAARVAAAALFADGFAAAERAGELPGARPAGWRRGKPVSPSVICAVSAVRFFAVIPEPMYRARRNSFITKCLHGCRGVFDLCALVALARTALG